MLETMLVDLLGPRMTFFIGFVFLIGFSIVGAWFLLKKVSNL